MNPNKRKLSVIDTVDMFPGLSAEDRRKAFFKERTKTNFEQLVDLSETIYGKLSQSAYRDLLKFHINNNGE